MTPKRDGETVTNREQELADAFVGLADTLAHDVDPVVLLDRLARHCVEIIGADAVGVMMATLRGDLRSMAVTDDAAGFLELLQLQSGEGPCLDCYRGRAPVDAPDLEGRSVLWPQWTALALRHGYRAAHALPLRVHQQTVGAVILLLAAPGGLPAADLRLAQALADVAALALVHWSPEPVRPSDIHTRIQAAVAAEATVEMATGMLAEQGGLSLPEALSALRAYTAHQGSRLIDTSQALVCRALAPEVVLAQRE